MSDNKNQNFISPITMSGAGEVMKAFQIRGAPSVGPSSPTQVFIDNLAAYKFAVGDVIYFSTELPTDYKAGSAIVPHLHFYSPNTTPARYIQWQIDWSADMIGDVVTAPSHGGTINDGDILLPTTANSLSEYMSSAIPGTGLIGDEHVFFKISRVASVGTAPAAGDNPCLVHFEFEYIANKLGA